MNEDRYNALLGRYKNWCIKNTEQFKNEIQERRQYCVDMQSYTEEKLSSLWDLFQAGYSD